jgi:hypothetical protein
MSDRIDILVKSHSHFTGKICACTDQCYNQCRTVKKAKYEERMRIGCHHSDCIIDFKDKQYLWLSLMYEEIIIPASIQKHLPFEKRQDFGLCGDSTVTIFAYPKTKFQSFSEL